MSDVNETVVENVNETETVVNETPVETVVAPVAPSNPYKKTNRVRKAKLHETLEAQLRNTERALTKSGATDVAITVERNNDASAARYARAIFDVTFVANGKEIPVRGKTAEEVLAVARGIRLALDLQKV